jgi:hypothetical protein
MWLSLGPNWYGFEDEFAAEIRRVLGLIKGALASPPSAYAAPVSRNGITLSAAAIGLINQ